MFALEIEYLTGRAVATARHNRDLAEWPPHPSRLFSALVAACHEADLTDTEREAGRSALRWLEQLPPPALAVPPASKRDVVPVFVPVNDSSAPDIKPEKLVSAGQIADAVKVLPERRPRQQRTLPSVTPERATVYFVWQKADPDGVARHHPILATLAAHLTYLGHSSSLVRASVCQDPSLISPTHEPAADGRLVLRVPTRGRLDELERAYARQARPSPGAYQAYREVRLPPKPDQLAPGGRTAGVMTPRPAPAESVFGDLIVCRLQGPPLPLSGTLRLTTAIRNALIEHSSELSTRVRELLSGHTADGAVSKEDHVAYIPLANVGPYRYADGLIKGFALVLPRGLGRFRSERRDILRALVNLSEIQFGSQAPWKIDIATADDGPMSLRTVPYVGPRRTWASVTPVLCDRYPKDKDGERTEDVIRESCRRVLGIEPIRVEVGKVSWHRGVPPSNAFYRIRKPEDAPRYRVHVKLSFDREVRGPLLLGAGRFLGLGLFRTYQEEEGSR